MQKRAKKTNFFTVPNLVSRLGGILGCGCHPLFEKRFLDFQKLLFKALRAFN